MEATPNRTFLCMEATYPYAIKNKRKKGMKLAGPIKLPRLCNTIPAPSSCGAETQCWELYLFVLNTKSGNKISELFNTNINKPCELFFLFSSSCLGLLGRLKINVEY